MRYKVERTTNPEGYWLIVEGNLDIDKCSKAYNAGYSLVEATHLCDRLNKAYRPNIKSQEDGLYVCWNNHEKYEACDYELVIPYAKDSNDLYDQCRELGYLNLETEKKVGDNSSTCLTYAKVPTGNTWFIPDPIKATNDIYPKVKVGGNEPDTNGLQPGGGSLFLGNWNKFKERRKKRESEAQARLKKLILEETQRKYNEQLAARQSKSLIHVELPRGIKESKGIFQQLEEDGNRIIFKAPPGLYVPPNPIEEINLAFSKLHIRITQLENEIEQIKKQNQQNGQDKAKVTNTPS